MDKIEVTMDISEAGLETLAEAILEDITDKVESVIDNYDFDDKLESAIDDYDLDDKIRTYFDYHIDIESEVKSALHDIDLRDYIDNPDVESDVRDLMDGFSPINACSTGQAAMNVIQSTIRYLLLKDEDFVDDIQNALDKRKAKKLAEEAKNEIIEEMTPILREKFHAELSEYFTALDAEKEKNSNTTWIDPPWAKINPLH